MAELNASITASSDASRYFLLFAMQTPVLLPVNLLVRFVVLRETSVRIHLETRLFPVGFDNNLVIPLPIRVVQRFRHYEFVGRVSL